MSEIFIVKDFAVMGNLITKINEIQASGKDPIVKISTEKIDRSTQQNRLMHLWFKDIHNSTNQGIEYESGRCKYQYFLPVLRRSEREEAIMASYVASQIEKRIGYEKFLKVLGNSVIGTTRFLSVKEFEEALTAMQIGESQHNLTDPSRYGMEVFR